MRRTCRVWQTPRAMHPRPVRSPRLPWGTLCLTAALLGAARWAGVEAVPVEAAEGPEASGRDLEFSPVDPREPQALAATGATAPSEAPGREPGTGPSSPRPQAEGEGGGRGR